MTVVEMKVVTKYTILKLPPYQNEWKISRVDLGKKEMGMIFL